MTRVDSTYIHDQSRPTVAAFDFDGTITYHDSLLPFLRYTNALIPCYYKLFTCLPTMALFMMGLVSRQWAKETILSRFFGGMRARELADVGRRYALEELPKHVRPEALSRLRWHQEQGHQCVLVSASVDLYLEPWAESVGFDHVLCSRLDVTRSGEVTGRLFGKNCWGPEKTDRLDELLGPREGYNLFAYGDSRGDHDLLSYADRPFYRRMPAEA
jgi:HAD superfamily hydrolase (TIGR01490 family)